MNKIIKFLCLIAFSITPGLLAFEKPEKKSKVFVKEDADVNAKDAHGKTALGLATRYNQEQICKAIMGIKLISAAEKGNLERVRHLVKAGILIDVKHVNGWTPFMIASRNGHAETCQFLMDNKANINATDRFGQTPLMWAVIASKENTSRLLIENKADIYSKDNYGSTALSNATEIGYKPCCLVLINAVNKSISAKIDTVIAFLGMNRKRKESLLAKLPRDVAKIIAKQLYEPISKSKQKLWEQINTIGKEELKQTLIQSANKQLSPSKNNGASHE